MLDGKSEYDSGKSDRLKELLAGIHDDYIVGFAVPVREYRRKRPNETKVEKQLREDANRQQSTLDRQWHRLKRLRTLLDAVPERTGVHRGLRQQHFMAELKYLSLEENVRTRKRELGELQRDSYDETRDRGEFLQKRLLVLLRYAPEAEGEQRERIRREIDSVQDSILHCLNTIQAGSSADRCNTLPYGPSVVHQPDLKHLLLQLQRHRYETVRKRVADRREAVIKEYEKQLNCVDRHLSGDILYSLKKSDGAGALNDMDLEVLERCSHDLLPGVKEELLSIADIMGARCRKNIRFLDKKMLNPEYIMERTEEMEELICCSHAYRFLSGVCEELEVVIPALTRYRNNMEWMFVAAAYVDHVFREHGFDSNYRLITEEEQQAAYESGTAALEEALMKWEALQPLASEENLQAQERTARVRRRKHGMDKLYEN